MKVDAKILAAGVTIALGAFLLDLALPLGVAAGVPYAILPLLGLRFRNVRITLALAALGSTLLVAGYFLSEPAVTQWIVLTNRGLALGVVWTVAMVVILRARTFERKYGKIDHALRHRAEILDQIRDAVIGTDAQGRITSWNRGAERIYGYTREEMIGKSTSILSPPEVEPQDVMDLLRSFGDEKDAELEVTRLTKSGESIFVRIRLTQRLDNRGKLTGYIGYSHDITEQKKHEDRIRVQAEMIEQTLESIISLDMEGNILTWNRGAERVYGWTSREVVGRNLTTIFGESYKGGFRKTLVGPLLTEGFLELETTRRRKSGEEIDVQISMSILRDKKGDPVGIIGYSRDITARKKADAQLKFQGEILEQIDDAVITVDLDLNVLSWNPGAERLYGYTAAEMMGRSLVALMPEEVRPADPRALTTLVFEQGRVQQETRRISKSGKIIEVELLLTPIFAPDGSPIGATGITRDISERKRAEAALRDSEAEYRNIFETSPDGIVYTDLKGSYLAANKAFTDMIGYTLEEVTAMSVADITPPEEQRNEERYITALLETGRPQAYQKRYARKDGSVFPVAITVWRINRPSGRTIVLARMVDITERMKAQERLNLALLRTEKADRVKSDFLSSMSHELRTPLNAVMGYGQLLAEPFEKTPQDVRRFGNEILSSGAKLLHLIDQVLTMAELDAEIVTASLESVETGKMLTRCVDGFTVAAKKNGITLSISPPPADAPRVLADQSGLRRVLDNLLGNAVKYNHPHGSVLVTWTVKSGDALRISISDTGPGISPEHQTHMFEAFNRLDAQNSAIEGVGVGLTIAKSLTELMGGVLGFESTIGAGSVFWLDFPIAETTQTAREGKAEEAPEPGDESRKVILYIEDNVASVELMEYIFESWEELDLVAAPTAEMGVEMAKILHPSAIIMDINLPGMNGFDALEKLHQDARSRDIPVLALSADAAEKDILRGRAAGFAEYLVKPVDIAKLKSTLETVMS